MYSSEVAEYSATYICCLMLLVLASQKDSISHSGGASLLKLGGGEGQCRPSKGVGGMLPRENFEIWNP